MKPTKARIRMYQMGFGDCFLVTFHYPKQRRHLLIDFGSMGHAKGALPNPMMRVAKDIAAEVGDDPFVVVATHRHKDHISGFDPGPAGNGTGAVIAGLKPAFVVQPWTEDPKLPTNATKARASRGVKAMHARQQTLDSLHAIASEVVLRRAPGLNRSAGTRAYAKQLDFLGQDNLKNERAVRNLMEMASNEYAHAGRKTRLSKFLPGVAVDVLGPPTIKQHEDVAKQRRVDHEQFWHLQAAAMRAQSASSHKRAAGLAAGTRHVSGRFAPPWARWCVRAMRSENAEQTLALVRILDSAMNNTSLILLFRCGKQSLLFPGDAQIENWEYALNTPTLRKKLKSVSLYKVGHHGSLNATPKDLWRDWFPKGTRTRAQQRKMVSLLSTMGGKHGDADTRTEVPRTKLVRALKQNTMLKSTESLKPAVLYEDVVVAF